MRVNEVYTTANWGADLLNLQVETVKAARRRADHGSKMTRMVGLASYRGRVKAADQKRA